MRASWWTLTVLLTAVGCGSAGSGGLGNGGAGNVAGTGNTGNAPGGGGVGNAPGGGGVGNAPGGGGVGNAPGGGGVGNAPGGGGVGNAPGGGGVGNAPGGGGVGNAPGGGGVGNAPGGGGAPPGGGGTGGTAPTCQGICGSSNPAPGSNPACYCDADCKTYNDCCWDYASWCGGGGTGGTGGIGGTGGTGATGGTGGTGATGGTGGGTSTVLDLRGDVNRDGNVDTVGTSDETGEDTWTATQGAIFLANVDDDDSSCPKTGTDAQLAACHDGSNTTIDGTNDLSDLARLRVLAWPGAPTTAAASISVTPAAAASRVRLFKNVGGNFTAIPSGASLSSTELKAGVELAIEGTDIRRDNSWDGYLNVTVALTSGGTGSDTVRMRMSPVMLSHHVQNATAMYVTQLNTNSSLAFRTDFQAACSGSGSTYNALPTTITDQWTQDFFETGYMSMPAAGGAQKIIRVYFRSANYTTALRTAGRVVYTYFHGPDRAGLTVYDPNHPNGADTLNSFGNTETIPPFTGYPLGRIMRGSTSSFYPDQAFEGMLTAQGMQQQVFLDTAWLAVAHVDETISFAKVNSPRGWIMVVNDAAMAKTMLQNAQAQGYGNTPMFVGKTYSGGASAQVTINQVLADSNVMAASNTAVTKVNGQVAVLKAATGITDAEIVKIPFLHEDTSGGYSVAFQPGTVNYAYVGPTTIAAPKTHGPVINGVDIFAKQMQDAFAPYGISVKWVENWDLYHRLMGEVHCGSNADRAVTTKWWESGK